MKINAIFLLCFLSLHTLNAQVGINNSNPEGDLDVIGSVIIDDKLFLEAPGGNTVIRKSKLLIHDDTRGILEYDIDASKYGPINYAEYKFENLNTNGLQDYDTKISTTDYILTVQGYYFLAATTGATNIILRSNSDVNNIEGYQFYAYPNSITGTWFLRGFVNDSKFQTSITSNVFIDTQIDLFLNVLIYRNRFIAKSASAPVTIDMSNSSTGVAPLPTGF